MRTSSQFTRSAVIAATMISVAATPAVARQADLPARTQPAVTVVAPATRHWTQPRVESIGVRPTDTPVSTAPAPAVPVTQAPDGNAGLQWLLIPLAGLMLALGLIVMLARAARHRAATYRARHV